MLGEVVVQDRGGRWREGRPRGPDVLSAAPHLLLNQRGPFEQSATLREHADLRVGLFPEEPCAR
eukprot:472578-Lingulodinium_polyedra.AAC.1